LHNIILCKHPLYCAIYSTSLLAALLSSSPISISIIYKMQVVSKNKPFHTVCKVPQHSPPPPPPPAHRGGGGGGALLHVMLLLLHAGDDCAIYAPPPPPPHHTPPRPTPDLSCMMMMIYCISPRDTSPHQDSTRAQPRAAHRRRPAQPAPPPPQTRGMSEIEIGLARSSTPFSPSRRRSTSSTSPTPTPRGLLPLQARDSPRRPRGHRGGASLSAGCPPYLPQVPTLATRCRC